MRLQNSSQPKEFSVEKYNLTVNELIRILNESDALAVEKVFAVLSVLRALGEGLYDKESYENITVKKDYTESPTWAAALILLADSGHELYELFRQEALDPKKNEKDWKEFERGLNDRV